MSDFNDYQKDHLYFLPLGGSGEYGGNLNLYQYNGSWLMIDLGISFADPEMPGIDVLMPDPSYMERQRHRLAGLIVTHAHEDHIGAIPYLWERLQCPIYVTPFAASFLYAKLNEAGILDRPEIHVVKQNEVFAVGPFQCRMVPVTHSIPESSMVEISTPAGRVIHTGDWKLDKNPLVGAAYDPSIFQELGEQGVMAVIGDSTNATVAGASASEKDVTEGMAQLFARLDQRIAVACLASNLGRVRAIAEAALANDRQVALVGRSLWRFERIARELGYLDGLPEFISPEDISYIPRNKLVLICTGSQGEVQAALSRIAAGEHPSVTLDPGDHVVFTARVIPGNELAIGKIQDKLLTNGMHLITPETVPECIYASGHPCQDELAQMYQWLRPDILVPVHGERRYQEANGEIGRNCQIKQVIIPDNGHVIKLGPGRAEMVGYVTPAQLALDGKALVSDQSGSIRDRKKMLYSGTAMATLVLDDKNKLIAPPKVSLRGLSEGEAALDDLAEVTAAIEKAFDKLPNHARKDDQLMEEAIRMAIRRTINAIHKKKPVTDIHIVRI